MPQISNPYITGPPVSGPHFYGREDIFRSVRDTFSSPQQNVVVLYGQRRMGKTSVLHELPSRLSPEFHPIYLDLLDKAQQRLSEVLYDLAREIAGSLNLDSPPKDDFLRDDDYFHERFLPQVYQNLGSKRLLLLFDEFETVDMPPVEGPNKRDVAYRTFFPYLRRELVSERRLAFIFATGRRLDELDELILSTFKGARAQSVSFLEEAEARRLVVEPASDILEYDEEAVGQIISITACHPYLTQLVCFELFSYMEAAGRTRVTVSDVEAVVDKAIAAGSAGLTWLWSGLPTAERFVLSAVAHAAKEGRAATQDEISRILREYYVPFSGRELTWAPDNLTRWELLRRTTDGYEFVVELLRRWILREHPLEQAKRELELVSPRAIQLYELGSRAHQAGELDEAIRLYERALVTNPNHVQAQLGLAQALFEQDRIEEAIIEYKEAYRLSEVMAQGGLIAAWQKRAEFLEKEGRKGEADKQYRAILDIASHDQRVMKWVADRWRARGRKYLAEDRYEEAVAEYEKAVELNIAGVQEGLIAARRAWAEALEREDKVDEAILRRVSEVPTYRNPFIFSGPIAPERFIGRKREVGTIFDRLTNPAPSSTAVSGEARIGKTSLLHYISSPEIAKKWGLSPETCTFIFMDSRTIVPFNPMELWRYVLKSLAARKAHEPGYIDELLRGNDLKSFELGELFDRIAQEDKLAVLLLDEFEHVVEHVSPDNPELLYLLRALINRPMRGLALVLASRKPLDALFRDFRFSGSPFPTSFTLLSLGPFSSEEANKLIDVHTRGTGVTFSKRHKEFAYEISKGHPYWLQKVCFKLFQRHAEKMTQRRSENEWEAEIAEEISEEMKYSVVATKESEPISEERVKKPAILHLSDLQFGPHHAFEDDQKALEKLKEDIDGYEQEGIPRPNIVVVSGDLADTGGDEGDEYGAVTHFLEGLCRYLGIDKRYVVLVPGNHDVNWYEAEYIETELKLEFLKSRRRGSFNPHGDVRYVQRFRKYAQFLDDFYTDSDMPCSCDLSFAAGFNTIYDFNAERGIAFLALNSCEKEDHHDENHYGHISPSVLMPGLKKMEAMIPTTCVKVAVFHHNALAGGGEDRLRNFHSEILPALSQAGFSLVLHGHTHKPDVDDLGPELTEGARVRVVGAGSVSVARAQRPGSDKEGQAPNQYWVLAFELGEERKQFSAYARRYEPTLPGKYTQGKWIPYHIFTIEGKPSDRRTFGIGTI